MNTTTTCVLLVGAMTVSTCVYATMTRNPTLKPPNYIKTNKIGLLSWEPMKLVDYYLVYRNEEVAHKTTKTSLRYDYKDAADYYQVSAVFNDVETRLTGALNHLPIELDLIPVVSNIGGISKPVRLRAFSDQEKGYARLVWSGPEGGTLYEVYDQGVLVTVTSDTNTRVPFSSKSKFTVVASDGVNYSEHSMGANVIGPS